MKWIVTGAAIVTMMAPKTNAQFSTFASASYGYDSNPLYNYQKIPDQIKQSYLQFTYGAGNDNSSFGASYVNGMAFFNRFADRNYLDHSLNGEYGLRFGGTKANELQLASAAAIDSSDGEPEERDDGDSEEKTKDSTDAFLYLGLKGTNRIDKTAYEDFDNFSVEQRSSLRIMLWPDIVLRINNTPAYRSYRRLPELSNVTDVLNLQVRTQTGRMFGIGINVGGGVKHYVQTVTDTNRFEAARSYTIKAAGHGKPGAKIASTRLLLANAGHSTSYQFVSGLLAELRTSATVVTCDLLVRVNSASAPRYLAQSTTTSGLNEDIYNDQFSYAGWESRVAVTQTLVWDIQAGVALGFQRRKYGAGAYNLAGDLIHSNRRDIRSTAELNLTRSINLFEGADLEVILAGAVLRNQSNDTYSDFSARNVSLGLGVGF